MALAQKIPLITFGVGEPDDIRQALQAEIEDDQDPVLSHMNLIEYTRLSGQAS